MKEQLKNIMKLMYRKLDKKRRLFPKGKPRTLNIAGIKLKTDVLDAGGYDYYNSRKSYEECSSKLYDLIKDSLNPSLILDIGANYGFISSISSHKMPQAKIIAIEPSKKLIPYIKDNFELNGVKNFEILNSICGESDSNSYIFSIHPDSSQDNRVFAPKSNWVTEKVSMTCIDSVLKDATSSDSVFIKIDTQGFEEKVFAGGKNFLTAHNNWIIKTEFAPHWLKSQNTDPTNLLSHFVENYEVAELSPTIPYFTKSIDDLFKFTIQSKDIGPFIEYIEKLNVNNLGWCDLIIRPKKANHGIG